MTAFDRDNLQMIFSALVDWWLRKYSYGANITRLAKPLVNATLDVYAAVQAQLLPTPNKSHYTFNLRDVSKVFQVSLGAVKCEQYVAYCLATSVLSSEQNSFACPLISMEELQPEPWHGLTVNHCLCTHACFSSVMCRVSLKQVVLWRMLP